MRLSANIAAVGLLALLVATNPAAALDFGIKDNSPIDVKYKPKINHDNNTTPIDFADPKGAVNDMILSGAPSPVELRAALKQGLILLSCKLGSADLLVANVGTIDLPAGTKLKWSVAEYGEKGAAKLKRSLDVGQTVRVADVLDGPAADGTHCAANVTGL